MEEQKRNALQLDQFERAFAALQEAIDTDDGDITATRDYATYRAAFENNAWRKVSEFADAVRPGRIVDVGCATGQTINCWPSSRHSDAVEYADRDRPTTPPMTALARAPPRSRGISRDAA